MNNSIFLSFSFNYKGNLWSVDDELMYWGLIKGYLNISISMHVFENVSDCFVYNKVARCPASYCVGKFQTKLSNCTLFSHLLVVHFIVFHIIYCVLLGVLNADIGKVFSNSFLHI